jgi:hypothetical protein
VSLTRAPSETEHQLTSLSDRAFCNEQLTPPLILSVQPSSNGSVPSEVGRTRMSVPTVLVSGHPHQQHAPRFRTPEPPHVFTSLSIFSSAALSIRHSDHRTAFRFPLYFLFLGLGLRCHGVATIDWASRLFLYSQQRRNRVFWTAFYLIYTQTL